MQEPPKIELDSAEHKVILYLPTKKYYPRLDIIGKDTYLEIDLEEEQILELTKQLIDFVLKNR